MLAQEIGRTVERARTRLEMSIDALAAAALLDAEYLGSVERGETLASTAKLDRIASALGLDAFALYDGREVERSLVVLPRYAARADFQHADLHVLQRALERATALQEAAALLGRRSLTRQLDARPPGADPAQDGYHCARLVRRALGEITQPLGSLPSMLAERFDVPVQFEALSTAALLAAAVRSTLTRAAAVVVNSSAKDAPPTGSLQGWLVGRVSICHELCHVLFDEPRGGTIDVVLDDAPREGQEKSPVEQRAGAFAAEMLIPLFGLRELLGGEGRQTDTPAHADRLVDEVRAHFSTPSEIAVNHLYNHGYVARQPAFREDLIHRARERELARAPEVPLGEQDAWRRALHARIQEAHDNGLIVDGTARALLELPPGEALPWERAGA